MKQIFIILFLNVVFGKLFPQGKEFNNWHFGDNCGLTFNTNPVSTLNNSRIYTLEGSSSISDSLGNLLFYTDGVTVYDKTNTQMPNGYGLFGHFSTTQSALIVPNPKKKNLYYIFTADAQGGFGSSSCGGCFAYSVVDMNLNGGMGDISSKNNVLFSPVSEKIAAYRNLSDSSFWVITHEYLTNNFYVYKVDSNGVNSTPTITNIGIANTLSTWSSSACGQMKVSPDGTKIAQVIQNNGYLELFDFNAYTGQISNPLSLQTGFSQIYGVEFSPNSKLLYITNKDNATKVNQYSLLNWSAGAILNSATILFNQSPTNYMFSQLQLAPDGKIYISRFNNGLYAINNPDIKGAGCNLTSCNFPLVITPYGPSVAQLGLPNFVSGFHKTTYVPFVDIVEPVIEECTDVIVPNILTPNGDKVNDEFKIRCNEIAYEPENLVMYNKWGTEVYNTSKKITNLNELNDGVYFYIFSYNNTKYNGYISIIH